MEGVNNGATYEHRITVAVRKGPDGHLFDEVMFAGPQDLRQAITLDGSTGPFSPADIAAGLSKAPGLVGPFTDMLTFYADLYLAMHAATLIKSGDSASVPNPRSPDRGPTEGMLFSVRITSISRSSSRTFDRSADTATLLVKHVPPASPKIRIPADWMKAPVVDTPNNFVQIVKVANRYVASIGKETFDVTLKVRLSDGVLISAVIDNPVLTTERDCTDAAATNCGESRPGKVFRHIELKMIDR